MAEQKPPTRDTRAGTQQKAADRTAEKSSIPDAKVETPDRTPEDMLTVSPPPASLDPDQVQSAPSPKNPDTYAVEDKSAMTMADVAALNGIGLAPDVSVVVVVRPDAEDVFISEGQRVDMEEQGWTLDPLTGRKITKIEEKDDSKK